MLEDGRILLTGVQGLVRLPLDQHRADRRLGLHTATMISGYQGSPSLGLDPSWPAAASSPRSITYCVVPGVNEDLGATAVYGSQLASAGQPNATTACSASGTARARASTAPATSSSTRTSPASAAHGRRARPGRRRPELQVVDAPVARRGCLPDLHAGALPRQRAGDPRPRPHGLRSLALLRALGRLQDRHQRGRRARHRRGRARPDPSPIPEVEFNGGPGGTSRSMHLLAAATRSRWSASSTGATRGGQGFRGANGSTASDAAHADAWLGIVAPGQDLLRPARGARRPRPRRRARALRHPPPQARDALPAGAGHRPRVRPRPRGDPRGRGEARVLRDLHPRRPLQQPERTAGGRQARRAGRPLVPPMASSTPTGSRADRGAAPASAASPSTRSRARVAPARGAAPARRAAATTRPRSRTSARAAPTTARPRVPEGSMARRRHRLPRDGLLNPEGRATMGHHPDGRRGRAVGRHRAVHRDRPTSSRTSATARFFHSGSLAIRQAVAAGVNITYKILYNSAVAMTGGQDAAGAVGARADALARGRGRQAHHRHHRRAREVPRASRWAPGVEVWHRDRLDEAQRSCARSRASPC